MNWLIELTGLDHESREAIQTNFLHEPPDLTSKANGRKMRHGNLAILSLNELRDFARSSPHSSEPNTVQEIVGDVRALNCDPENAYALFQVASQFNLLEMPNPNVCPEDGVSNYQYDHTQGPACAIACGAGTIYRNYFHMLAGQLGQTRDCQIDCLKGVGDMLGNDHERLWRMQNGYALASRAGLEEISSRLSHATEAERDQIRGCLQIGIQWYTDVTISESNQRVSQAFCSALPVAYCEHPPKLWEPFARLVLEAAYEATLCAAVGNVYEGSRRVYLTLLGGGAFGNRKEWIVESLARALLKCPPSGLDVRIVSYGRSDLSVNTLVKLFTNSEMVEHTIPLFRSRPAENV